MGRKPRCVDVPGQIIKYLRDECAISTSNGLETTTDKIAEAIDASGASVSGHLRRMIDLKIIILKKGVFEQGYAGPKAFALNEGYEDGDSWRKIYNPESTSPSTPNRPALLSKQVKEGALASSNKDLLEKLLESSRRIIELQQQVVEYQNERNAALATVEKQQARIIELEDDLRLTSESSQTNLKAVADLELQLRETLSRANSLDRQIARNDDRKPAFASSARSN